MIFVRGEDRVIVAGERLREVGDGATRGHGGGELGARFLLEAGGEGRRAADGVAYRALDCARALRADGGYRVVYLVEVGEVACRIEHHGVGEQVEAAEVRGHGALGEQADDGRAQRFAVEQLRVFGDLFFCRHGAMIKQKRGTINRLFCAFGFLRGLFLYRRIARGGHLTSSSSFIVFSSGSLCAGIS